MDNDPEQSNDVESVLKYGAAALFGEGNKKEAITYDSAAVDKLLDRSAVEETKTNEEKSAESAFAFARVWANDKGALADDLQVSDQNVNASVWDEILQQREEEAKREAERNREILGRGGRRRGVRTTHGAFQNGDAGITDLPQTANYSGPRFEFDDGQDAAAPESDHGDGDGDGDFVGSDKSDGETSEDEEAATPATGESIVTESNVRKAGTKASQGTKSQKSSSNPYLSNAGTQGVPSAAATPKAGKKATSRTSSSPKGMQSPKPTPRRARPAKTAAAKTAAAKTPVKTAIAKTPARTPTARTPAKTAIARTPVRAKAVKTKQTPRKQSLQSQSPSPGNTTAREKLPGTPSRTVAAGCQAENNQSLCQLELDPQDTSMAEMTPIAEQPIPAAYQYTPQPMPTAYNQIMESNLSASQDPQSPALSQHQCPDTSTLPFSPPHPLA
jgi:hypothetical protein